MRISDKTFLAMVGMGDTLTQEQMDTLKQESAKTHMPMQSLATKKEMLTDEAITRLFSEYTQIPYAEIDPKKIPKLP